MKNCSEDLVLAGHAISPGLAIGKAFVYTDKNGNYKIIGLEDEDYRVYFSMRSVNGTIEESTEDIYIEKDKMITINKTVYWKECR